jgi:argininosuccinate lyase
VGDAVIELQQFLLDRAVAAGDVYLPGYTHLQRAQPVLLAHHLLAHGWALARDVDRLLATYGRLDVSPLGAGALAGSSLPLDPAFTARDLGFANVFENSLDAVSDRDFVVEALFDLTMIALHLARLGEEWVLWTTDEFGFARLDDAYATGSSMMPQKKNPTSPRRHGAKRADHREPHRSARHHQGCRSPTTKIPGGQRAVFDAVDQVLLALAA